MYVDVDPLGSNLRITGADEVNGSSARLRIGGDRFVIVYISPKPTPTRQRLSPVSQQTRGSSPTPTAYAQADPDAKAQADAYPDANTDVQRLPQHQRLLPLEDE